MRATRIRSLKDLVQDHHNANRGTKRGAAMLQTSLKRYGAGRSVLVDRRGRIIAGNKTVAGATEAGMSGVVVVPTTGDKLVVVQRTDLDLGTRAARELAIADNRVGEVNLDWDPEELKFPDVDLSEFWNEAELRSLGLNGNGSEAPEPQLDEAAKLQKKWKTARGQIWKIGKHRLMCGDSRTDVAALMNGDKGVLMNTDPPYGIDYSKLKDGIPRSGFSDHQEHWGDMESDTLISGAELQAFLEEVIRAAVPHLTDTCAFYLWHPMLTQGTFFAAAAAAADILIHRQIIWVKPGFVLTRSGMYHWKHELCFYGWRRGHQPPWYGDKSQTTVWEVGRDEDSGQHQTQKPIELFSRPILNHSKTEEIVYEPFSGSGSQFCAAEQTGRRCYGMEIEPKYVAVALERLSEMGLKPKLLHEKAPRPN